MPFYAVRRGRQPGIYSTWTECQKQTTNFKGCQFKKFENKDDADKFMSTFDGNFHSNKASNRFQPYKMPNKMQKAFYAVQAGRKTGVFATWAECQEQIFDYAGARFKKFDNQKDAELFVGILETFVLPGSSSSLPKVASREDCAAVVHTDGCCLCNGKRRACAGLGVFWGDGHANNLSEKLEGRQTNNRAEIEACCRALEQAKSQGIKTLEIRTDSQFVIKSMTQWIDGWKKRGWMTSNKEPVKNKEDFQRLDECLKGINVIWTYVEAHCGIHGNEEADRLAKKGAMKK